jgi:PadR family transcriptional regulator PadR
MDAEKSDLLQGTLDMLILKVVAMGPIHGYAISKRIRQISNDVLRIQQGSLYPALHRLENRKWLTADWREAESGREAKFYALTASGRKQLEVEELDWKRISTAIGLVMRTSP